ncbi:carboxylesterase family protein [Mucilaginibacter daejeonensis]|uniref:carboxylesterase/lipase family protein n=1 Tax=Mucilaginibacter daejeonensis TaxID=398049 RepID=UPI001D17ABC7|nr:carboxylesterase family protein [Mucilaginibacter daejeonensis]UEG52543.1 carboxylesterase family protein [Mucilaginibacter daejeonensis]
MAQTGGKDLQVRTANGIVEGVAEASGVHSFKGIPFAQPPVGELRWTEPKEPKNWEGVRRADHFGPQAMQPFLYTDMIFRSAGKSEDCLYLNVWAPANAKGKKLPVLVYFYGGGLQMGDGSEGRYDGENMATKGMIAITVNYRLGVFGFMAHPELTRTSVHHSSGNYGLMDQHAALLWVQKNIAAFGGDPKRVTIAGESAGSMSVSAQVVSPLSKGLFAGAIGESGAILGNLAPAPLAEAEQAGVDFAKKVGATTLSDLRKIPAEDMLRSAQGTRFYVTIDGYFLTEQPQETFNTGQQMKVPLLAGWNSAEGGPQAILGKAEPTIENYKAALQRLYPDKAQAVVEVYKPATDADVEQVATELASDRFISYATWKFTDLHSRTSGEPVYRYYYTRPRPATVDGKPAAKGASHSAEIEYAMGNLRYNKVYAWSLDDHQVSNTMQSYFVNFIKTGNPNGIMSATSSTTKLPKWYSLQERVPKQIMIIDVNSRSEEAKHDDRYQLMNTFYNK